MSFLKKMFDFNINENFTEKEKREIDEIAILQDYIDRYNPTPMAIYICRTLISNGFSAKEAINTVNEERKYIAEDISILIQLKEMCSTDTGLDYTKYKELIAEYFSERNKVND